MVAALGWFLLGLTCGGALAVAISYVARRRGAHEREAFATQLQAQLVDHLARTQAELQSQVAQVSRDALSANTRDFLQLAESQLSQQSARGAGLLEEKRQLIDNQLQHLATRVGELQTLVQSTELKRREQHGALDSQLNNAAGVISRLQNTTEQLRQALANPQRRGAWGERIAEDVLRLAGLVEGVSYWRQAVDPDGRKPDFTFPLPNERVVHMDVKFPLANYLRLLDAPDAGQRAGHQQAFLKDVRERIREVRQRNYIDPESGTLDCVLVFIPNEQIYGFIHEHDPTLLDDALRSHVVLCSPLTLYAVLAVMRQTADAWRLQQASHEILELLAAFQKQWEMFSGTLDKLGKHLDGAANAYQDLMGVRSRQLQRQLDRIDALRSRDADRDTPLVRANGVHGGAN